MQVGPDSVALLLGRPFEAANFSYPLRGFYILHKTLTGMTTEWCRWYVSKGTGTFQHRRVSRVVFRGIWV